MRPSSAPAPAPGHVPLQGMPCSQAADRRRGCPLSTKTMAIRNPIPVDVSTSLGKPSGPDARSCPCSGQFYWAFQPLKLNFLWDEASERDRGGEWGQETPSSYKTGEGRVFLPPARKTQETISVNAILERQHSQDTYRIRVLKCLGSIINYNFLLCLLCPEVR